MAEIDPPLMSEEVDTSQLADLVGEVTRALEELEEQQRKLKEELVAALTQLGELLATGEIEFSLGSKAPSKELTAAFSRMEALGRHFVTDSERMRGLMAQLVSRASTAEEGFEILATSASNRMKAAATKEPGRVELVIEAELAQTHEHFTVLNGRLARLGLDEIRQRFSQISEEYVYLFGLVNGGFQIVAGWLSETGANLDDFRSRFS